MHQKRLAAGLKCTKFDFGWGSTPDPAGGAQSAPPDSIAGFKGSYFQGKGRRRREKGRGRRRERGRDGKEGRSLHHGFFFGGGWTF